MILRWSFRDLLGWCWRVFVQWRWKSLDVDGFENEKRILRPSQAHFSSLAIWHPVDWLVTGRLRHQLWFVLWFFSPAKMRIEYDRVDQWSLINGSGHHPHKYSFHTLCWNAWHNTEPNQLYPERGQWNLKTGYNTHTYIYNYIYITSSPFTMAIRWHIIYIHTHTFSVYIIYTHAYVHIYVEKHAHINCTYRHILYLGSWIL